jgi:hypothetical protein
LLFFPNDHMHTGVSACCNQIKGGVLYDLEKNNILQIIPNLKHFIWDKENSRIVSGNTVLDYSQPAAAAAAGAGA